MTPFHPVEPPRPDAALAVPLVLSMRSGCRSVADFGCNNGQWLAEFVRSGIAAVVGVDGPGMADHLYFPRACFLQHDLREPLDLGRRFDLALCIEVAEHLPESAAGTLVDTLCRHADAILFSAATPGQGGFSHVNEQPHDYWTAKFRQRGYVAETAIRSLLSEEVAWWLRANLCLVRRVA